jgi:DNA polymerase sigma
MDFIEKPLETEALGALVLDFFHYYGTIFPYGTSYICVSEGKLLPKSSAQWIKSSTDDLLAIQCLVRPSKSSPSRTVHFV